MSPIKHCLKTLLERTGFGLHRVNRQQLIPPEIPDPELYRGPENFDRLYRPWLGADSDRHFTPAVVQNTMLSRQKLYFLMKTLRQCRHLEGDVFEAGVGSGGSARLMLEVLQQAGLRKRMWLLDTFEGYQKVDAQRDGAHAHLHGCKCDSVETVAALLRNDQVEVRLIKGLIPATLAQVSCQSLAFAHIDVNLYEPTLAATRFCLERLTVGGLMVFDDYNWPATYGARVAIDQACAQHTQDVICLPESTQAFLVKRAPSQ